MKKIYNVMVMVEIDDEFVEHDSQLLGMLYAEMTKTTTVCDPALDKGMALHDLIVTPLSCEKGEWTQKSAATWQASLDDAWVLNKPRPMSELMAEPDAPVLTGLQWGFDPGVN